MQSEISVALLLLTVTTILVEPAGGLVLMVGEANVAMLLNWKWTCTTFCKCMHFLGRLISADINKVYTSSADSVPLLILLTMHWHILPWLTDPFSHTYMSPSLLCLNISSISTFPFLLPDPPCHLVLEICLPVYCQFKYHIYNMLYLVLGLSSRPQGFLEYTLLLGSLCHLASLINPICRLNPWFLASWLCIVALLRSRPFLVYSHCSPSLCYPASRVYVWL